MSIYREIKSRTVTFIAENNLINTKDKIVLAVSGGMDSMFLLHTLLDLKEELGIDIAIGHINHNIRENSIRDEKFVIKAAEKIGIPVHVKKLDFQQKADNENTEAWAREYRYMELENIRKELKFDKITTAHNSNDQVETILQRISDKAGISGLRGIHKKSGKIIRPILTVSRKEIENSIKELKIDYVDDETNQDISLKRNYFRHQVIPEWEKLYPKLGDAFQSVSDSAEENKQILDYFFHELENSIVVKGQESDVQIINTNQLEKLPLEIKTSFFSYLLGEKYWRRHQWNELKKIILNAKPGKIYTIDDFEILKDRTEWIIRPKLMVNQKPKNIKIDETIDFENYSLKIKTVNIITMDKAPNREFIDRKKIENKQLLIRRWQDGDVFHPIGMKGTKKISDYLIDEKINKMDKNNQLVLTADDEIIWLCGHRLSEKVKIDDKTKEYLELSIKSNVG